MLHLEAGPAMEQLSTSDEIKDGTVLKIGGESSSSNGTRPTKSNNRKKR